MNYSTVSLPYCTLYICYMHTTILQYHEEQLNLYLVFIIMPLTDLPVAGQVLAATFGFVTLFVLLPFGFFDVFLLFYQARQIGNLA